jgi:hypothetical protein
MIRKKNKRRLFYILLSLAVFLIWGIGIYDSQYLKQFYPTVSVRMENEKVTKKALIQAMKNEEEKKSNDIPVVTAWNRKKNQTIVNQKIGTKSKAALIEAYGDMKQVYPMEFIYGNIVYPDDFEGCVIDKTLAYHLFRTTDVVGNFLQVQNKQYCIRGVITSEESLCMIQCYEEDKAYSNLELIYQNTDNGEAKIRDFMLQNMLGENYSIIDGAFYAKLLGVISQLPAWLLSFYIMYQIMKQIWKRRSIPLQAILLCCAYVALWFLLTWITDFKIHIPKQWIPTRWSDFDFWSRRYKEFHEQLTKLEYIMPIPKDIIFIRYARRCIFCALTTLISLLSYLWYQHVWIEMGYTVLQEEVSNQSIEYLYAESSSNVNRESLFTEGSSNVNRESLFTERSSNVYHDSIFSGISLSQKIKYIFGGKALLVVLIESIAILILYHNGKVFNVPKGYLLLMPFYQLGVDSIMLLKIVLRSKKICVTTLIER